MKPKILVGCPTSKYQEYCLGDYHQSINNLTYENYSVLLIDNSEDNYYLNKLKNKNINTLKGKYFKGAKQRIIESRNLLRQHFLENNYDYLLSLEQDVIPPRDVIEKLLSHNKDIVSAVYFSSSPNHKKLIPLLAKNTGLNKLSYLPENLVKMSNDLVEVDYCGLGCVLIHKLVLEKVKFRFDSKKPGFDDWWFCKDAKKNDFKVYADLNVKCRHLILNRPWNWGEMEL